MAKKISKEEDYFLASQWKLMGRKLVKHKLAKVSLIILGFLYLVAIFGNFIAPQGLTQYDSKSKDVRPTKIHMWDTEGKFHGLFVYGFEVKVDRNPMSETYLQKTYVEKTDSIYKIKWFVQGKEGDEYKILGLIPCNLHLFGTEEGGRIFLMGTDSMGRDIFSRLVIGSQVSLSIPLVGTAISFVLGILLGGLAGYFGGWVDTTISRIIEVISSFPSIPLWMALSAAIPPSIPITKVYLYITIIMSFISWTGLARIVRGKFISLRKEDFVMAARLAGVSDMKIIIKHLVPGFLGYLIVSLTLGIPSMIIGETSMSFLGLGMRSPATSWGVLLQEAQNITNIGLYPWKLIPLFFVIIAVLAFNFLGDGLRDAADPYK
ncbi:MAG: ABC transporter permease [Treponemataceae bacterium]|nr:ABC transporter permease [Treponemataceae bacterium]